MAQMQEVARSRMAGHRMAGQVEGSRARRQETIQDKERKTRNSGVERQGETKNKNKKVTVAFEHSYKLRFV